MDTPYVTPDQKERQARADSLHDHLYQLGRYPTAIGEQSSHAKPESFRANLAELPAGLDPGDVYALELVAYALQGSEAHGWQEREEARFEARMAAPMQPKWASNELMHWRIAAGCLLHRTGHLARACLRG